MDGNIYASLSRNLAEGIGSFWDPSLTDTFFVKFHEHPPLALGMQAIFFWVIGDYFWVEKLFSLVLLVGHIYVIRAFWKQMFTNLSGLWLVVLFYALVPTITWSFSNNMLENTMAFYSGLAVLCLYRYKAKLHFGSLLMAAIFIVAAFHSKGPVSLFPLAVPFFLWLCFKEIGFWKMVFQTLFLLALSVGIFAVIFYSSNEAGNSWIIYFNKQVLGTITAENPSYGVRRTFILERLVLEMAIPLGISIIYWIISKFQKSRITFSKPNFAFFGLLGLSAILPIMVSPKQWSFYTVPSILYLVIALAIFVKSASEKLGPFLKIKFYKPLKSISLIGILIVFVFSIYNFGKLNRDQGKLGGIMSICNILPEKSFISADPVYSSDWNLSTYFIRYKKVSLDFNDLEREYFIGNRSSELGPDYEIVFREEGEEIILFKKIEE